MATRATCDRVAWRTLQSLQFAHPKSNLHPVPLRLNNSYDFLHLATPPKSSFDCSPCPPYTLFYGF